MNRRKFLIGLPILAGGATASWSLFQWIRWNTAPDLGYLAKSGDLLAAIADTLLPKTDSPAASECGVHDYIIRIIRDCTDTVGQNRFIMGLQSLEKYTRASYGKSFKDCMATEKKDILIRIAEQEKPVNGFAGKAEKKILGPPFFRTLKQACMRGYCTSEGGATQALRYSHIPGKYVACEPYSSGQKAWATS